MPKIIFQPLMIANPQSIKRLGHFLTTDCKSVETPNGRKQFEIVRSLRTIFTLCYIFHA